MNNNSSSSTPLSRIFTRLAILLGTPLVLISCDGCKNDEEPDQGVYVATASPMSVEFTVGDNPVVVTLEVKCTEDCPDGWQNTVNPGWDAFTTNPNFNVTVANVSSFKTTATISYEHSSPEVSSLFTGETAAISFATPLLPLGPKSGPVGISVTVRPPNDPPIQEASATDPSLVAAPPSRAFRGPGNQPVTFTYNGSEDAVATVVITGADGFTITGSGSGPVKPGETLNFNVVFDPPNDDEERTASIKVTTDNEAAAEATFTGTFD